MDSRDFLDLIDKNEISDELKAIILQDHFQRQSELRASSQNVKNSIFTNGPFLAALASVVAALLSGLFAYTSSLNQTASNRSLEGLKFDFEIIRTVMKEEKSPQDRLKSLQFFKSVGLLGDLPIEDVTLEDVPGIFTVENLYPDTAATLRLLLDEPKVAKESRAWKKFWHLYGIELIGIESDKVASAMIEFGNELNLLEEHKATPNDKLRGLANKVIEAMALEVPIVSAYKVEIPANDS